MSEFRDIPDYTWVKLAKAASSLNVNRKAGDTCSLLKGGSVEIIGADPKLGTLARYKTPYGEAAAGALCPSDALVWVPTEIITTWPPRGEVQSAMRDEAQEQHEAVQRLLEQR